MLVFGEVIFGDLSVCFFFFSGGSGALHSFRRQSSLGEMVCFMLHALWERAKGLTRGFTGGTRPRRFLFSQWFQVYLEDPKTYEPCLVAGLSLCTEMISVLCQNDYDYRKITV